MSNEELVLQIQAGKQNLMKELWEQNKALVYTTVKKYAGTAELDDLMQEGYLALNKAAESYDTAAGTLFSTYAVKCIQWNIMRYIKGDKPVKVAAGQQDIVYKWQQLKKEFHITYNRKPTELEACYYLGIDKRQLLEVEKAAIAQKITSLDTPVGDDDSSTLSDILKCPNSDYEEIDKEMDHENMKNELWSMVDRLEDMQAKAIHLKYQEELSAREIGERLNIDEKQVRALERKGINELRRPSVSKKLRPYYDEYMAAAYRRTSLSSFRYTFTSSEEWHILQREAQGWL